MLTSEPGKLGKHGVHRSMIHVFRKMIPAPEVSANLRINCPRCGAKETRAVCYTVREVLGLIVWHKTHWVKCLACGTELYSRLPPKDLAGLPPDVLEGVVVFRRSFVARTVTLLAVLLFWTPLVGLMVSALAVILNWRSGGWPKRLSLIALVISALLTAAASAFMIIDAAQHSARGGPGHAAAAPRAYHLPGHAGGVAMSHEITFIVEEDADGRLTAHAEGRAIFTAADTREQLVENVRAAVRSHFGKPEDVPRRIRLHYVHDEVVST